MVLLTQLIRKRCFFSIQCRLERRLVTFGAEVIYQNDLLEELWWRPVKHAVHGAKQRGPHFIHEAEDHAGGRQVVVDETLCTAG